MYLQGQRVCEVMPIVSITPAYNEEDARPEQQSRGQLRTSRFKEIPRRYDVVDSEKAKNKTKTEEEKIILTLRKWATP
jgi:hypothetical protein